MKSYTIPLTCLGAATALLASGCAVSASGSSDGALTYVSFGSSFQDNQRLAWQEPYTEETGVEFVNDSPPDLAKLRAMVDGGNTEWDLVTISGIESIRYCDDLVQPIDESRIDRSNFPEELASPCGVPTHRSTVILMYDTEKFADDPPTSVADFFDLEKYPGKRGLPPAHNTGVLEQTLLGDGVAVDDLYPLDVDRALNKLDSIRGELSFTDSYGQLQQMVVDRQVDMALMSTSRTYQSISEGAPFAPVWDTTVMSWDALAIPKGSPNTEEALEFIAYATTPERQKAFSELATVFPVNEDVNPDYDDTQEIIDVFAEENDNTIVYLDSDWWAENDAEVVERYQSWMIG